MSNQELMRSINEGAVKINHERWSAKDILDVPVYSLVFWPNSGKNRTTLV